VVSGDDVLPRLFEASTPPDELAHLFTGEPVSQVRERLVFGNAYLGAAPIVEALDAGAEIVITGRVADAALFLGPLVHALGWDLKATDQAGLDRLAQGLTVGHLLECSGQGSGGNFGSQGAWKEIPDLAHIGYPIAEVWEDGTALITKAPGTGGRVNFDTLRQQLLSRLQVPHQAHLVIEGATAVDAPVRHHPRKGRVLPVLLRARLDRHHIHMRGKQHRGQGRIIAGPAQ
jgi:hypothetical protein